MTSNHHLLLGVKWAIFAVGCGLMLRFSTALHSYSGEGKPPMHGDFEAQRHWMEVTVNSPVVEWYKQTSFNDLQYWGLDYPPLTAYHSWAMGTAANYFNKSFVEPVKSRGLEGPQLKLFMRSTVFVADVVFILSMIYYAYTVVNTGTTIQRASVDCLLLALINPAMILVDHGHFQYNNVSLGLTAAAVAFIQNGRLGLSALAFTSALNYKQMSLYHSIPFFVYLLTKCIYAPSFFSGARTFFKLAVVVLASFLVFWFPFLIHQETSLQVLRRVFPVDRGIFEDKVGNIWCVVNIFYKVKLHWTREATLALSVALTLASQIPSIVCLLRRPSHKQFVLSLITGSLGFFLFSYQVHEKSILLVVLPVILYTHYSHFASCGFSVISHVSLLHLAIKDDLLIVFVTLLVIYLSYLSLNENLFLDERQDWRLMLSLLPSAVGAITLVAGFVFVKPPERYPDIWPLLTAVYSCVHFVGFYVYFVLIQFQTAWQRN